MSCHKVQALFASGPQHWLHHLAKAGCSCKRGLDLYTSGLWLGHDVNSKGQLKISVEWQISGGLYAIFSLFELK